MVLVVQDIIRRSLAIVALTLLLLETNRKRLSLEMFRHWIVVSRLLPDFCGRLRPRCGDCVALAQELVGYRLRKLDL
jgi:hypothetical protein